MSTTFFSPYFEFLMTVFVFRPIYFSESNVVTLDIRLNQGQDLYKKNKKKLGEDTQKISGFFIGGTTKVRVPPLSLNLSGYITPPLFFLSKIKAFFCSVVQGFPPHS